MTPARTSGLVVESRMVDDVEDAPGRSRLGIVGAVDQALDAGEHDGSRAHGAGLQGHVEGGLG